MEMTPRLLKAEEIDLRVGTVSKKKPSASFLLYKDARCDMSILDEMVGPLNWKREHTRENANCIVSIWDDGKCQWVSKEDTGTESNTEKEKGLASDSFKRACVNWGIGRELYTAPMIWISLTEKEYNQGKPYVNFFVQEIGYEERQISSLTIVDQDLNVRYTFKDGVGKSFLPNGKKQANGPTEDEAIAELSKCKTRADVSVVWSKYPQFHEKGCAFYNAVANVNGNLKS